MIYVSLIVFGFHLKIYACVYTLFCGQSSIAGQNRRWEDLQAPIEGTFRLSNAIVSSMVLARNITPKKEVGERE